MTSEKKFGEIYTLYTIENESGLKISVTDLGAAVQSLIVPDRNGNPGDVVLGYDTPEEYLENGDYLGAFVGRYANRIGGAKFTLNGKEYRLTANEGRNTLHGGVGMDKRRFAAECGDDSVSFSLRDADGADGFPGNVEVSVRYALRGNELIMDYTAVSDADTVINLTNHCYYNLRGEGNVLDHQLMINSDAYIPVDGENLPLGGASLVEGTAFDFRSPRKVEKRFYDHNYILRGDGLCAVLYDEVSGREMTVTTDLPGVQFYCGGCLSERKGKNGAVYGKNSGLCLETQFFPDSPNHPDFPSCVLKKGEVFKTRTVYRFGAK